MRTCSRCLLPETYPDARFDRRGVCAFCRGEAPPAGARPAETAALRQDLEAALAACRGRGAYDCVVMVSGGKDSAMLAWKLVTEYGLRPLAVTVDTGLLSPVGIGNTRRIVETLDLPHLLHRPPFAVFRKIYAHFLANPPDEVLVHAICRVCSSVMESCALSAAAERGIPLVLAGYAPNQPPDFFYEVEPARIRRRWLPEGFPPGYLTPAEEACFWDPSPFGGRPLPRILSPWHVWEYNADDIARRVVELGLIPPRKASPLVTNCRLNAVMMAAEIRRRGYNPYIGEFSALVRQGKLDRTRWLLIDRLIRLAVRTGVFRRGEIGGVLAAIGTTHGALRRNFSQKSRNRFHGQ